MARIIGQALSLFPSPSSLRRLGIGFTTTACLCVCPASKEPLLSNFSMGTTRSALYFSTWDHAKFFHSELVLKAKCLWPLWQVFRICSLLGACSSRMHHLFWSYYFLSQGLGGDYSTIYVRPTSSFLSRASVIRGRDGLLSDEVKLLEFPSIIRQRFSLSGYVPISYQVANLLTWAYSAFLLIELHEGTRRDSNGFHRIVYVFKAHETQ